MALEARLSSMEVLVKDFEALQAVNQQFSHRSGVIEARVVAQEKLLSRYSVLPKLVEQHHQAITSLQRRIFISKLSPENNHHEVDSGPQLVRSQR